MTNDPRVLTSWRSRSADWLRYHPRMSKPTGRSRGAGKLRIGDDWNAIRIIALSQANPLKAVAELVENSIDAGAHKWGRTAFLHAASVRSRDRAYYARRVPRQPLTVIETAF